MVSGRVVSRCQPRGAHSGAMQATTPPPPRRPGVPLGERPVAGRQCLPVEGPVAPKATRRHCWVQGPPEAPGPHHGLVLEWRQAGPAWRALVIYVVEGEDGEVTTVQQWVARSLVEPA